MVSLVELIWLCPRRMPLDREIIVIIFINVWHSQWHLGWVLAQLPHGQKILSGSVLFVLNAVSFSLMLFCFFYSTVSVCVRVSSRSLRSSSPLLVLLPYFWLSPPIPVWIYTHFLWQSVPGFSSLHRPVMSSLTKMVSCVWLSLRDFSITFRRLIWTFCWFSTYLRPLT